MLMWLVFPIALYLGMLDVQRQSHHHRRRSSILGADRKRIRGKALVVTVAAARRDLPGTQ
jgi:hypothetical protein